jgi:ADP-L-glycero-D-manno-heptose 6-epimerase
MIVITGAVGFIGSCMVRKLLDQGMRNLILSDDFSRPDKNVNIAGKACIATIHRDQLPDWLERFGASVEIVYHFGARTDTTEKDPAIFDRLNLHYSQKIWSICTYHKIPLIYASSAATYGSGAHGYCDDHKVVAHLKPLNPYGISKNDFDRWVLAQPEMPPFWAGLKFFNVYGPNEYHKGRMASVIFHTVRQIKASGAMKLFRSHRPEYADGMQARDFIYIKDLVNMCLWLWEAGPASGLYNIGTGKARSFLDLATATFSAMGLKPNISYIDIPEDIRDTYQYFTEADMHKLRSAGYEPPCFSLEAGIKDYVQHFLLEEHIW